MNYVNLCVSFFDYVFMIDESGLIMYNQKIDYAFNYLHSVSTALWI